ncbi:MAG: hypothetical protein EBV29_04160 [Gammaproteobacteria bacterium]|nr:hypothetical protein [Gammaproteobacteria bacterium]
MVLRSPRGVHPHPAGLRRGVRDHSDLLAQTAVRLRVDGLRLGLHRLPVVHRLGAPHVHRGHAAGGAVVLHVVDDADRRADRRVGKLHFWLSTIGVNVLFFPQHFLGLAGMPRRIPDYSTQFADWNMVSSIGAFLFGFSQLLFVYVIWSAVRSGEKAADRPWEGAHGLEWELPTPAPYHSWDTPPSQGVIAKGSMH